MSKKGKTKKLSNSDKLVAYLKAEWQGMDWCLADLARYLFPDYDKASTAVKGAYERSTLHAFNGASAKLRDNHNELLIWKSKFEGSSKIRTWGFATTSDEDRAKVEAMLLKKEHMAQGFGKSWERAREVAINRGFIGGQGPASVS